MDSPPASIRAWARRLVVVDAASKAPSEVGGHQQQQVFERLRVSLAQFVGVDGFTALMRRALVLARPEIPWLQNVKVSPEGRLEGIEGHPTDKKNDSEAAIAITAHLLALLVTFIGEPLTVQLLRDMWPDESRPTTLESEDLS